MADEKSATPPDLRPGDRPEVRGLPAPSSPLLRVKLYRCYGKASRKLLSPSGTDGLLRISSFSIEFILRNGKVEIVYGPINACSIEGGVNEGY